MPAKDLEIYEIYMRVQKER